MNYIIEKTLKSIKEARIRHNFSQRELSSRSGVPQSHISKIESGQVDIRISSLIAIARVLELELFVAPKKYVPAINAIIESSQNFYDDGDERQVLSAYHLDGDIDE